MKLKLKKRWIFLFALILALGLAVVFARPLYNLYRDVCYYWTDHTPAEETVKAYAEEQGISYGEYPQSILDLLERNPETEDFVLNYPFRNSAPAVDLSPWESRDTVPLFLQWDRMWGYEPYGSDCVGVTGCGPTCLAMVGYYLTGDENMTPDQVAKFAESNGYYESGYGSSWTLISQGAQELGLTVQELPLVKSKITNALDAGTPVILALGPGTFTSTGHYIVLTGTENGFFRVNDPNSRERSGMLWSYEELEGQIRNIWAIGYEGQGAA